MRLLASPGTAGHFLDPAFSPDGSLVAFVAYRGDDFGHSTLQVVPAAGGTPREIETGVRIVTEAAFSHDGRRIYVLGADGYTRTRGPAGNYPVDIDLYVIGIDGSGLRRLTQFVTPTMGGLAAVQAEGKPERVFVGLSLVKRDADGQYVDLGPNQYVTFDPEHADDRTPVWNSEREEAGVTNAAVSPDGARVAYVDGNRDQGLFVLDRATQTSTHVSLSGADDLPMVEAIQWFHHRDALLFYRYGAQDRSGPTRVNLDGSGFADIWIDPADVLAARAAATDV